MEIFREVPGARKLRTRLRNRGTHAIENRPRECIGSINRADEFRVGNEGIERNV